MAKNDKASRRRPILRRILVALLALGGLGTTVARSWAHGGNLSSSCPTPGCSGQYIALSCGINSFSDDDCSPGWHTKRWDIFRVDRHWITSQNCTGSHISTEPDGAPCSYWSAH